MYVRLAFSVAAHLEPEILLVDEVLAVGDAEFQRRCLGRMEDFGEPGPDRAVRLAQHAGGRAALRPRDPARRRPASSLDGPSAEVVAHYLQSGPAPAPSGSGPTRDGARRRSRAAPPVRVVDEDGEPLDTVDVRRPVGIEIAFDGPARGRAGLPEDQAVRRQGRRRVQRDGHEPALERAGAARRVRATAGSRGTSSTRGSSRSHVAVCSIGARSSSTMLRRATPSPSTCTTRVRATRRADSSPGKLQGVVRPLLEWT